MPESRRKHSHERQAEPARWLLATSLLLLLLGLGSSLYLGHLHLKVQAGDPGAVESFCAVSDKVNCVVVASSDYSLFLGLPLALYGVEFFGLALVVVLLSSLRRWRLRRWDSLIFLSSALALPLCGLLAWVSAVRIRSVCLLCLTVYGVVAALFLLLLLSGRGRLGELVTSGPRELWALLRLPRWLAGALVLAALALSQFFWVPALGLAERHVVGGGAARARPHQDWHGLPTAGLSIGPASAPVQIEEFTDFQCPYCGNAHETMVELLRRFPGKIRLTHRDFPLDNACHPRIRAPFHPHACRAAIYARCAAAQGLYWPLEEHLFRGRDRLDEHSLRGLARAVGLDLERLVSCVEAPATQQAVRSDIELGLSRGVEGTPTFFINGERIVGLRPIEFWEQKVRAILGEGSSSG